MSQNTPQQVDESLLICKLIAQNFRTLEMWRHQANSSRYRPPSFTGLQENKRTSRESSVIDADSNANPDEEPAINLTFDKLPMDPSQGYVFGSDTMTCDVFCGKPERGYHICNRTFAITFDDQGRVVLQHMTEKTITDVQYPRQKAATRRKFTCILFPGDPIYITVAKKLKFEVVLPNHGEFRQAYRAHRERYLQVRRHALPPLGQLGLGGQHASTKQTKVAVPNVRRFYYKTPGSKLGRGTFGKVFEVRDASSGHRYAAKEYLGQFDIGEVNMLKVLRHNHIVSYIEHTYEDTPMLVMEYLEGNNLRKQSIQKRIDPAETAALLQQILLAIRYMHGRARRVIHRDIKPENILFKSRDPVHVKLGDFGTACNDVVIQGSTGTPQYLAPEVFSEQPYDGLVDIWSLGVVIFDLLWPLLGTDFQGRRQGPRWCEYIVRKAEYGCRFFDSMAAVTRDASKEQWIRLLQFVTDYMLKIDPRERRSADFCLGAAVSPDFQLWPRLPRECWGSASQTDPFTAMQQTRIEGNARNEEDVPALRDGIGNSHAIQAIAEQPKIQDRILKQASLAVRNPNDAKHVADGKGDGILFGLPRLNPPNAQKRQPRNLVVDKAHHEPRELHAGQKREAPADGPARVIRGPAQRSVLAPYQHEPNKDVDRHSSGSRDHVAKRARLVRGNSNADRPTAHRAPRPPRGGKRKTRREPGYQRITRNQAKQEGLGLL